ncbi:MAG TPA: alpha amylase C-terminal domain-containing protein [Myxococcales bacterium]|jgi:1,4-alpha-glucan branching enzyme
MTSMSQAQIGADTPMGANLVEGGATFKVWAPSAKAVYLNGNLGGVADWEKDHSDKLLVKNANGYWTGFVAGAGDGDEYKYYVVGEGSSGFKRDPYARELTKTPSFPIDVNCILRSPSVYPWHDRGFETPAFSDMIVYQVYVGTFASAPPEYSTFLEVIERIEYLAALGINALQPLPVTEAEQHPNFGYGGADFFSPEPLFVVYDKGRLAQHLTTVNRLLAAKGQRTLTAQQLASGPDQLRALVDLCHLYGIAVVFDVVYNHGGGFEGDDESIYFWDRQSTAGGNNASQYFIESGDMGPGGLAFALWKEEVRGFLVDNAKFWLTEFHADGLRYDEISLLLQKNTGNGWRFCQDLTGTVRFVHDRALQNAEYWPGEYSASRESIVTGAGFDTVQHDALRLAIVGAIKATPFGGSIDMEAIGGALRPQDVPQVWNAVPCVENHDTVHEGREQRIPILADSSDPASFYARSRAKVATGILLAAPGIPQLFVGQEFLEAKQWADDPKSSNRPSWEKLDAGDKPYVDQLRFTQDLIRLRWNEPALRSDNCNAFYASNADRVLAFHRSWNGRDIVVVASLSDAPLFGYQLGMPRTGHWAELFNSDVYDNWVNPLAVGNAAGIEADGAPMHGLPCSAAITIPPRAIVLFSAG